MKDGNEHFFVPTPANTGLRGNSPAADGGVGDVTLRAIDLGSFKSPSLRNVEVTAPYGHDGRFTTLDAVIDHYSQNAIVDPSMGYMVPVGPLKFTVSERAALVAFLKTLTDRALLTDRRFSSPFVVGRAVSRAGVVPIGMSTSRAQASNSGPVLPVTDSPAIRFHGREPSPAAAIARLASFDGTGDSRISRDELPERMRELVARGDRNADAVLDAGEIRALVSLADGPTLGARFTPRTPEGLPGVIRDLKLSHAQHLRAVLIVGTHRPFRRANDSASRAILREMKALMNDEEYENFLAAAARLPESR